MATKKCPNGHQYDSSIYGDNCPFCPSQTSAHTVVNNPTEGKTKVADYPTEKPTIPSNPQGFNAGGGATVIRRVGGDTSTGADGRHLSLIHI